MVSLQQELYSRDPTHVQVAKLQSAIDRAQTTHAQKEQAAEAARKVKQKAAEHLDELRWRLAQLTDQVRRESPDAQDEGRLEEGDKLDTRNPWRRHGPRPECMGAAQASLQLQFMGMVSAFPNMQSMHAAQVPATPVNSPGTGGRLTRCCKHSSLFDSQKGKATKMASMRGRQRYKPLRIQ